MEGFWSFSLGDVVVVVGVLMLCIMLVRRMFK